MAAEGGEDAAAVAALEADVRALQISYERQADTVRALKADKKEGRATAADVDAAVKELAAIKKSREDKVADYHKLTGVASEADEERFKERVNDALTRRLFFLPAYKIYNGTRRARRRRSRARPEEGKPRAGCAGSGGRTPPARAARPSPAGPT